MHRFEKICLIALFSVSALALAALAIPGLVVIGFFLLILPGLILAISPVIALYGWLFAVPYATLRSVGLAGWRAALVAMLVPLAFGFGRAAPSNAETRANLAAATTGDIRPARPLAIGGTVALVRDGSTGGWHESDNGCDDLCLRLLYNGNAKIVYLGQVGRPGLAFTIERRPVCPPFAFSQDVLKWHSWPSRASGDDGVDWPPPPGLKEVVEARIAGGDCLVRISGTIRPDWTIERIELPRNRREEPWSMAAGEANGERITVYRRDGAKMKAAARFTNAYAAALSVPLMPELGNKSGWSWGRTTIGDSRWDWDSVAALHKLVAFNPDIPEGTSSVRMRELLAAALADPRRASDDAGLLLANSVMVDIARNGPKAGDAALLARSIADDRFTKIEPSYEIAKKLGADYAIIVDQAIARLGRLPTSDRKTFPYQDLNAIISQMPEDWFASPPSSLTNLLRDPVIAARAEGIIAKLDAGSTAAVPLLTDIVTRGAERVSGIKDKGYARSDESDGIYAAVAALCRIGAPARTSLGPIIAAKRKLIATSDKWPDANPGKYSALWQGQKVHDRFVVTLVSFGVPLSEIRPPDQPGATLNGSWQNYILRGVDDHNCSL